MISLEMHVLTTSEGDKALVLRFPSGMDTAEMMELAARISAVGDPNQILYVEDSKDAAPLFVHLASRCVVLVGARHAKVSDLADYASYLAAEIGFALRMVAHTKRQVLVFRRGVAHSN